MIFWITATALTLITAGFFALALIRRPANEEHPAAYDLRVYRDQLKEVDRDLARGVIAQADAERIRTEVSRRILAADAQMQKQDSAAKGTGKGAGLAALALGLFVVASSFALYIWLGAPGYRDMPLQLRLELVAEDMQNRPSQAEMEARLPAIDPATPEPEFAELMAKLRAAVAENPDDLQGQMLLARNEANLGNLQAAYAAQEKVLTLKGAEVSAGDYVTHASMMIAAAQDYVSPEAEASLRAALAKDPLNNLGRYYYGLMMWQGGRPDAAYRIWDQVLRQSPADAPWVPSIRATITELAWYAGIDYKMPELVADHSSQLAGPTAEDVQAAQDLSQEDRQAMIQGMVSQLSDRLATEGGTPEEWARLIAAYGVLGENERAATIWQEAQQVFENVPEALAIVRTGAERAGVAQP
ncbi:c-type cytochrome biogenesis protein CcmI [Shimia marina]|uniref:Cytochrome c-type biogenesis protein CcmI n=1 Tax=Shimia marina TaxID=321267 RepID=A0A0P1EP51_9RHOB|nr:c-type cytochrome biogenesis protein CcmI [Shimia marina]CUH51992.1 cytochrome c-type biogenesis protein CcmI [Shimia marina]SFE78493.1 cytochrome c-type biogenesis protein CcmH [Shimia marina]